MSKLSPRMIEALTNAVEYSNGWVHEGATTTGTIVALIDRKLLGIRERYEYGHAYPVLPAGYEAIGRRAPVEPTPAVKPVEPCQAVSPRRSFSTPALCQISGEHTEHVAWGTRWTD